MSSSYADVAVSFADEDRISSIADQWLDAHTENFGDKFSVVEFLVDTLIPRRKRPVSLKLFDKKDADDNPGFVTFDPDVIHIDNSVWALANDMYGFPQFVVAHEIGHILLHSVSPKGFSKDQNLQIKYFEEQHSAEWQANEFASHLILPKRVVGKFNRLEDLIAATGAWEPIAKARFSAIHRPQLITCSDDYSGQVCIHCNGVRFTRKHFTLTCKECNASKSIFSFA